MRRKLSKHTNKLEGRSVERIPPPLTLTFENLITASPVATGMTDEVW